MGQAASSSSTQHEDDRASNATTSAFPHDPTTLLQREEVAKLPLVPHFVYALLSEHVYNDPDRRPLPAEWSILMTCADVDLDREGYFAAAYVNETLGHCIIAERGTSDVLGVRAGVWMYFDEPTIQFSLSEQFSKQVRLRLSLTKERSGRKYFISYTGHSLGAVLAACRACAEHTYAITFESPGCKTFVEKTMHPFRADDVDIITYLRAPNPINTLKPQCGYLVQLPYVAAPPALQKPLGTNANSSSGGPTSPLSNAGGKAQISTSAGAGAAASAISNLKAVLPSMPNPQEYLRTRLISAGVPELQQYLSKIEPVFRELLEQTQQVHSIHSIVSNFEHSDEPVGQDVVLTWPSHMMQFLEYYNITKSMEDPINQQPNVYAAYDALLQRLYLTAKRPKSRIPLRFLTKDAQKLVRIWTMLKPAQKKLFPFTELEARALNTNSIQGENLQTSVMTAFQMKQYLSLILWREEVKNFLDRFAFDVLEGKASKL
ncbi:Hypothetical protein, putative [Bodo saltans]|uniref:Fungal lipase-like domain-containing protein n=1 Tax=Bodo saltans TaxID=75058 RepID=A0A0S4KE41_BODSA|nr:Hypothetical protein, putative [Bodo saltans]|eukprot:CUI11637.1 Hypothetical protein, putative [Bodo saltans]